MSGWGRGRRFFPLARDWEKHPLYQRQPDRDLALLLMRDAHETDCAEVRFSYPVFMERTAWWDGNDRRRHGRDALRNALGRMADHGFCTLPEPAQRRGQGRQQGWFVVTICNYDSYRLGKDDQATRQTTRPAQADNKRATPSREVEPRVESSVPSELALFDGATSARRRTVKVSDPRIHSLKTAWIALYRLKTGEEPATFNHGAWGSLCRAALKSHDEPTILERANAFFGSQRAKMQAYRFEAFFRDFATLNGKSKAPKDWIKWAEEWKPPEETHA